jgi:hypothetical protein
MEWRRHLLAAVIIQFRLRIIWLHGPHAPGTSKSRA